MKISKKITSIILTVAMIPGLLANAFAAVVDYGAELTNMPDKTYVQVFDDVPKSYWAFDYIAEMADRGVLNGYPDGNFYPENSITRAEFAKIMTSAAGLGITDDYSTEYEDVPYGDWSASYINAAKWYLSGYVTEGGTYYYPEITH